MTAEEKTVYDLISNNERITQMQIAKSATWLGSHPKHEGYPVSESTLRKVRQIIRNLRLNHGILILSDVNGYWVMKDRGEVVEYLTRIEKMAKAQSKAWFETYSAMKKNFGVNSDFFNKQGTLFN